MTEPSSSDVFARAQVRLALLFAGLVILLVLVSSLFTYLSFSSDIRGAARQEFPSDDDEQEYVAQSLGTLRWQLLAIDAGIVVVIGVGGLLYARRTLRPIRENVAAQKRFIADASHELRTPLAVMRADFEVALRDPSLAPESRPVLESGLEEVDGMSALVQDLLTLSRIDAHQEQLAGELLDLEALTRQTTEKLRSLAAAAGVELVHPSRRRTAPGGGRRAARAAGSGQRRQERGRACPAGKRGRDRGATRGGHGADRRDGSWRGHAPRGAGACLRSFLPGGPLAFASCRRVRLGARHRPVGLTRDGGRRGREQRRRRRHARHALAAYAANLSPMGKPREARRPPSASTTMAW